MSEVQIGHQVQTGINMSHFSDVYVQITFIIKNMKLQNSLAQTMGTSYLEIVHKPTYSMILVDMI